MPAAALARVAERANRPIIITSDTFLGRTGVGGFLLLPETIGQEAGQLAMRILGGESPSSIPPVAGDNVKPIFDWRQLKLWNVDEAHLPPGSEVRFREPSFWEQYYWRVMISVGALLVQDDDDRHPPARAQTAIPGGDRDTPAHVGASPHESPCDRGRDVCHDRA
ncbi:hypothetical protein [Bradyrhizobium sp. F1.13.3]|uniref:hypothetical protein n=1 Tax=Bradyrhizobium sp. F1.13.3 TaxID=3156351 RepID=UPI0033948C7A